MTHDEQTFLAHEALIAEAERRLHDAERDLRTADMKLAQAARTYAALYDKLADVVEALKAARAAYDHYRQSRV